MRTAVRHRLTGHAAEIGFYATLALVPATVAVGTTLSVLKEIGGQDMENRGQDAAISVIRLLIGPRMADSVVAPFVRTQLTQPNGGVAISGIILAWWMFSHLFTATGHALDAAYGLSRRRRTHVQRLIALSCVVVCIAIITVTMALMVGIKDSGHAPMLVHIWAYVRWPLLVVILMAFMAGVFRYVPSITPRWRDCLPGAIVGVVLWAGAAAFFRLYVSLGAGDPTGVSADDPKVVLIGRTVGAVVGTAIFIYFSAFAVLIGAELNAELDRRRAATLAAAPQSGPTPAPEQPTLASHGHD